MFETTSYVTIRCFDTCVYNLLFPDFFLNRPKAIIQKIIKWLFLFNYYEENQKSILFLDRGLSVLGKTVEARNEERTDTAKKVWRERQAEYEKAYLDPNPATFPPDWTKDKKHSERERRKELNANNRVFVKNAKKEYEQAKKQAVKDLKHAKMVCEIYFSEKR